MARAFPTPESLGIHPARRALVAWSCHPSEQEDMQKAGWVMVHRIDNFDTIETPDGVVHNLTAMCFIRGDYTSAPATQPTPTEASDATS